MNNKYVLIYSGGLDSTVLLYDLLTKAQAVDCVSIDYGQRHARELSAAKAITTRERLRHDLVHINNLVLSSSSQTNRDKDVPRGHYEDESMKLTVVPNRNMMMLSVAAALAIDRGYDNIAYAAHAGDHAIYPDCRDTFIVGMQAALNFCHYTPVNLHAPFTGRTKADIVRLGARLRVPFADTWSCYDPQEVECYDKLIHCGACGTCTERREAFKLAEVEDPTRYAQ